MNQSGLTSERIDGLPLFAHLLQKTIDWHLKLVPEEIDQRVLTA